MTAQLDLIPPRRLRIIDGGTNHGGRALLPHIARLQAQSEAIIPELVGVDPIPGRARRYANEAAALGLRADAHEGKIEDFVADGHAEHAPVVLNVDTPEGHARALYQLADRPNPDMGALFATSPEGHLIGWRYVHEAHQRDEKRETALMYAALAAYNAPGGRDRVWGTRGRPEHQPQELVYREWAGRFVERNLAKIATGVRPDDYHLEMTLDGRKTMPVIVRQSPDGWAPPATLAAATLATSTALILKGEDFVIAEVRPDGVRFHLARIGKTDGILRVHGAAGFDPETQHAVDTARAEREVAEALARAERSTITRSSPIFTTD
jgi:hypothetical protein